LSGSRKKRIGHAAILAIAAWLWASAALAHAVLLGTSPAAGTALAQSPQRIVFAFNETVVPADVRILDANGTLHAGPTGAEVKDGAVTLTLAAPLPPGQYVAAYRVASADTHPISGAIRFSGWPSVRRPWRASRGPWSPVRVWQRQPRPCRHRSGKRP